MRRLWVTHLALAGLVIAGAAACGGDDASTEGAPTPAVVDGPGRFKAKDALDPGYELVSSTGMPLIPGRPEVQVLISRADLDPEDDAASAEAARSSSEDEVTERDSTENVQVFAYTDGQWREVFDAAEASVPLELQPDYGAPDADDAPDPVLDQTRRIENTEAQLVHFAADRPALLLSAEDKAESHVLGVVAVLDFRDGTPRLEHYEISQDLAGPTLTGEPDAQEVQLESFWYPWLSGGDPTPYTRTIGLDDHDRVAVIADSRPFLGAWVAVGANPGVTISHVVVGSPAEGALAPGDRILGVNGSDPDQGLGPDLLELDPGDPVTLTVARAPADTAAEDTADTATGSDPEDDTDPEVDIEEVTLTLADMSAAPGYWDLPAPAIIGAAVAPLSGRPGIAVTRVDADGPADAAGLQPGDALLRVGSFAMTQIEDLEAAVAGRAGEELSARVQHADGTEETVTLTPAAGDEGDGGLALL